LRFVGIDPSTKTGMVVLDDITGKPIFIAEKQPRVKGDPERFSDLAEQIMHNVFEGDTILIEGFSYGSKGQAVSTQYGIGWMIRHYLRKEGFQYIEIPPTVLKKFATGKGNCKKDEMVLPIFKKWGFEHKSDNVRDAYVLAQIGRAIYGHEKMTKVQEESLKKVI
jgi:crossover junction endodeoxyribonuclease RuvC